MPKDPMVTLRDFAYQRAFARADTPLDRRAFRIFPGGVAVALSVNK